jgi:cardiolipin synthase
MHFKDWKRDIFTIPNLLSIFRIGLIPVYIRLYLNAREPVQYYTAGAVLAVSCLTDAVDGKIARHYNMISTLGIILDPVADKITQFALTFCLSLRYPALNPVLVLFIIKELFQLTLGAVNLSRGKMIPGALMTGKICTTVLFISLTAMVLFPRVSDTAVRFIAAVDASFLLISFISYLSAYLGSDPRLQNLE